MERMHWFGAGFSFEADPEDIDFLDDTLERLNEAKRMDCRDHYDLERRKQHVADCIADIQFCATKAQHGVRVARRVTDLLYAKPYLSRGEAVDQAVKEQEANEGIDAAVGVVAAIENSESLVAAQLDGIAMARMAMAEMEE